MFIESIKLKNILSFGPDTVELKLCPLNVLIGPNGSGKSNLIEIIDLLRSAPSDISQPISRGGGVSQWIWQGKPDAPSAKVEVAANPTGSQPLRYALEFMEIEQSFSIVREELEEIPTSGESPRPFFGRQEDRAGLYQEAVKLKMHSGLRASIERPVQRTEEPREKPFSIDRRKSVLAEIRHPQQYPELANLAEGLGQIKLYREWAFGRNVLLRRPQQADLRNDFLGADATNLGLVLSRLKRKPVAKRKILDSLCRLYHGITDYNIVVEGGTAQILVEEGDISIPASRLSDGTLRFLCLLVILCDPNPPPLVCIEEPELGLHPDILSGLTDLMREASERCQLVVTTHSDMIVDALTDTPESIVVCEKEDGQTRLKRLNREDLSHWLEKYRLGELWSSGQIGGNRW